MPSLAKWAEWCNGRISKLFYNVLVIPSEVGAQQGDPLSPLLIALTLPLVEVQLNNIPGLNLFFSFLDDLVLGGKQLAVAAGITYLKNFCINISICELVPVIEDGREGITWFLFVQRLLGTPIGTAEYCPLFTANWAAMVQISLDIIREHLLMCNMNSC